MTIILNPGENIVQFFENLMQRPKAFEGKRDTNRNYLVFGYSSITSIKVTSGTHSHLYSIHH